MKDKGRWSENESHNAACNAVKSDKHVTSGVITKFTNPLEVLILLNPKTGIGGEPEAVYSCHF